MDYTALLDRNRDAWWLAPSFGVDRYEDTGPPYVLDVRCRLEYEARETATFLFNVLPSRGNGQAIRSETLVTEPKLNIARWTERNSGNRFLRIIASPGAVALSYQARVERIRPHRTAAASEADSLNRLPLWAFRYLNPSRYCPSDRLSEFASTTFDTGPVGADLVQSVCDWLALNIAYRSGASDALTCAVDTLHQRAGVCRDFAHLAIAICRALSIPARYVTGYAWRLDPPDFHALIEVYCDGRWQLFDPTGRSDPRGLVRIGTGLDAAEVPFSAFFGDCELTGIDVACVAASPVPSSEID